MMAIIGTFFELIWKLISLYSPNTIYENIIIVSQTPIIIWNITIEKFVCNTHVSMSMVYISASGFG